MNILIKFFLIVVVVPCYAMKRKSVGLIVDNTNIECISALNDANVLMVKNDNPVYDSVHFIDLNTYEKHKIIQLPGPLGKIASNNNSIGVAAKTEKEISIIDVQAQAVKSTIITPSEGCLALDMADNFLATLSPSGLLSCYDVRSQESILRASVGERATFENAFLNLKNMPENLLYVIKKCGRREPIVYASELPQRFPQHYIKDGPYAFKDFMLRNDGKQLIALKKSEEYSGVTVFDFDRNGNKTSTRCLPGNAYQCIYSSLNNYIVSINKNKLVKIWDVNNNILVNSFTLPTSISNTAKLLRLSESKKNLMVGFLNEIYCYRLKAMEDSKMVIKQFKSRKTGSMVDQLHQRELRGRDL